MVRAVPLGASQEVIGDANFSVTTTHVHKDIQKQCSEEMRTLIGEDLFLFAVPILRYNKYGWRNMRLLVLTQQSLLILKQRSKKKEVRLRTSYEEMEGLTFGLHQNSHEFVLHIQRQADLRFKCQGTRKVIIETIQMVYATNTCSNLPIYGVRQKNLGMYTTQESDVVKGISRTPLPFSCQHR